MRNVIDVQYELEWHHNQLLKWKNLAMRDDEHSVERLRKKIGPLADSLSVLRQHVSTDADKKFLELLYSLHTEIVELWFLNGIKTDA